MPFLTEQDLDRIRNRKKVKLNEVSVGPGPAQPDYTVSNAQVGRNLRNKFRQHQTGTEVKTEVLTEVLTEDDKKTLQSKPQASSSISIHNKTINNLEELMKLHPASSSTYLILEETVKTLKSI